MAAMIAGGPWVNWWTTAVHAGEADPAGMQPLLSWAVVDVDGLAADLGGYVIDHLGDPGAVLIVDQTGDVKGGQREGWGRPAVHGYRRGG